MDVRDSLNFCDACSRSLGDGDGGDWLSLRKTTLFLAPTMESMENPNFDLLETADDDCGDCRMEDIVSAAKVIVRSVVIGITKISASA